MFLLSSFVVGLAIADPSPPVFAKQYTSHMVDVVRQGPSSKKLDCDFYFDAVANKTAYRNCAPAGMGMQQVVDFNARPHPSERVWYVYGPGPGGNKCAYYCDVLGQLQQNIAESLNQYDYVAHAKFANTSQYDGEACDVFTWKDKLGPIPMADLTLYVKQGTRTPVHMHRNLHPLFKEIGTMDTTWSNYTEAVPPASAWDVPDEQKCEEGTEQQCPQSATLDDHRVMLAQLNSALNHKVCPCCGNPACPAAG